MKTLQKFDPEFLRERLQPRPGKLRLVIDTDAANEIDDQFAIAWALLSPDRLQVEATTAEPFSFRHHIPELQAAERAIASGKQHSENLVGGFQGWISRLHKQGRSLADLDRELVHPRDGMELSYNEILRVYDKLGMNSAGKVFRGAERYMDSSERPVKTAASQAIIDLAKSGGKPLYVAAMGCVTNVAAALLLAPEIASNIVVIWTSAYPSHAPHNNRPSLNLVQDVPSARLLFDSGVPLVYLPGYHVGAQLRVSRPEIEKFVRDRGAIGTYLADLFLHNPLHKMFALDDTARRTWVIWDMIDIAWLINPDWVPSFLTPTPVLSENLDWIRDERRHLMREGHDVQRDEIFLDFYDKLNQLS